MAVLRRTTSTILGWTVLAITAVTLVLGAVGISDRAEARLPALAGWVMLATSVHALAGERASRTSILFAAFLSLPVVATAVAAYDAHERWNMPASWGLWAVFVVLVLFGAVFMRALVASGSADYPYDD